MTTFPADPLTDRPGTAEDALVRAVISRGLPLDPEVAVVAAKDIEGFGALRAVETGGNLAVAVLPDRGEPRVWLLALPLDQAGALGRLVAEANAAIEAAEPVAADEHEMTTLAEVRIGPGEVLRAMFVDADQPGGAGFALWRVADADGAAAIFTSDVVAVGLAHASELCDLVADAVVGRVQAPVGGTLH